MGKSGPQDTLLKLLKLQKGHTIRPSKLTPLLVDLIVDALTGGLTRAETATAIGISERTLYNYIAEGKTIYLLVFAGEVARDDLTNTAREKLRLFEALHPEPEQTPQEQIWQIQDRIEEKRIEKAHTANESTHRKELRKQREKARNAERAEARKEERFYKKTLKKYVHDTAHIKALERSLEEWPQKNQK